MSELEDLGLSPQYFQPVPREIVRYWLEGAYAGGIAPSVAYDQLGWALMVRGFYQYRVEEIDQAGKVIDQMHRGYCIFDLFDGEIRCHGFRLKTESGKNLYDRAHPMLWKSDVSALRPDAAEHKARLTCALRLLTPQAWRGVSAINTELADPAQTGIPPATEVRYAIEYLAEQFQADWEQIDADVSKVLAAPAASTTPVAGSAISSPASGGPPTAPPTNWSFSGFMVEVKEIPPGKAILELEGTYSTFGAPAVGGRITFTRIDKLPR